MAHCSLTGVFGRLLLLFANLNSGLIGLALIVLGIYEHDPSVPSGDIDWATAALIIALIGSVILVFSLLGIAASLVNSSFLLKAYAVALLMLVLLVTSVYAYVTIFFTASTVAQAAKYFHLMMADYTVDSRSQMVVEMLQKTLYCCGETAPADWHTFKNVSASLPEGNYPASCCNHVGYFNESIVCKEKDLLFTSGCFSPVQISRYVRSLTAYYLIALTGLLLLVFTAACLERDHKLQTAKRINRQFAAHMETCRSGRSIVGPSVTQKRKLYFPAKEQHAFY